MQILSKQIACHMDVRIIPALTEVYVQILILMQVLHLGSTCALAQRALTVKAARTGFVELVGNKRVLMAGLALTTLLLFQNTVMTTAFVLLALRDTGARERRRTLHVREIIWVQNINHR
jgi:hypothetical protein